MAALVAKVVVMAVVGLSMMITTVEAATWCVARSGVGAVALQTSLDYACGAGADCAPIQPSGLCYLPNTVEAHASYAFNSFYQRKAMAPGSCDFSGTSTLAGTDPSYGSCVYPSSQSAAGGGTTIPATTPTLGVPMPPGTTTSPYGNGGLTPGVGSVVPNIDNSNSKASLGSSHTIFLVSVCIFVVLSFLFQPM
ncbi:PLASMODESMATA CALLOSE-BINDING PROTEIN 3-like [Cornus florida]|uniref:PLASMODESMATA CALLOSE-BINDING PROTEIN 3-like n=1 Tax=Cornus florida TaxID=4283 RepID=UPI00289B44A6|nr:PLASMODESMATA CALLOSE-BINDING PROTEIN 3-like [Cornus florida]